MQIIEKFDSLVKFFQTQSEYIKYLEDTIHNFTKFNKGIDYNSTFLCLPTIIVRVAAFVNSKTTPYLLKTLSDFGLASSKLVGEPQLKINFSKCNSIVIHYYLFDIYKQL